MTGMILGLAAMLTLTPGGAPQEAAAVAQKKAAAPAEQTEYWTNVRIELSITDQTSGGAPVRKSVALLLTNGGDGRVRSHGIAFRETGPEAFRSDAIEVTLNADVRVLQIEGSKVRTAITVEYAPGAEGARTQDETREQRGSTLNQSVWVVLTSGEPTVIVESSDPLSDRKVTLAATATILR